MDSMNDGAEEIFGMEPEEIGGFLNVVFEQLKGLAPICTASWKFLAGFFIIQFRQSAIS